MLKQRIITALILLAVLLPALFYPSPEPFTVVMLVVIAAAGWEWGRLNGYGPGMSYFLGAEALALCGLSWWVGVPNRVLPLLWLLLGAAWVLATPLPARGAIRLAGSTLFPNQALRYGACAYGVQFHPEVTMDGFRRWQQRTAGPERRRARSRTP